MLGLLNIPGLRMLSIMGVERLELHIEEHSNIVVYDCWLFDKHSRLKSKTVTLCSGEHAPSSKCLALSPPCGESQDAFGRHWQIPMTFTDAGQQEKTVLEDRSF